MNTVQSALWKKFWHFWPLFLANWEFLRWFLWEWQYFSRVHRPECLQCSALGFPFDRVNLEEFLLVFRFGCQSQGAFNLVGEHQHSGCIQHEGESDHSAGFWRKRLIRPARDAVSALFKLHRSVLIDRNKRGITYDQTDMLRDG